MNNQTNFFYFRKSSIISNSESYITINTIFICQFDEVDVKITFDISAKEGKITKSDYHNKIHEAMEQMEIKPKKEIKK